MTTIALPRPQPHSDWLARIRTIGLGLGGRGIVGLGLGRSAVSTAAAAVPYSLVFDGGDYVDFGTGASINNLHGSPTGSLNAAQFTVDLYYRTPATKATWITRPLFGQGDAAANGGWLIYLQFQEWTPARWLFNRSNSFGSPVSASLTINMAVSTWYYVRARWQASDQKLKLSINAGTEALSAASASVLTTTQNVRLARAVGYATDISGMICYAHLWNTDKGALASVPTSPFVVDANTAGRWVFGDGAGSTLADTSGNGNTGTITGATWGATVPVGWTI